MLVWGTLLPRLVQARVRGESDSYEGAEHWLGLKFILK